MSSNEQGAGIPPVPPEKFAFVRREQDGAQDMQYATPAGYLQDALLRFVRNRGSVACLCIIMALVLYAVLAPLFSPYGISARDAYYAYAAPRNPLFAGTGFWDGTRRMEVNRQTYDYLLNVPGAIAAYYGEVEHVVAKRPQTWYRVRVDTYARVGWAKVLLTREELDAARAYERESGAQLFYPVIDASRVNNSAYASDANAWFLTDSRGFAEHDEAGNPVNIYLRDDSSPDGFAYSVSRMGGNQFEARVLYREWYRYKNGRYASFLFGAEMSGYDIFTRLAHGARLSLLLSVVVAAVNLCLGIIIGALEGYYGGTFDLLFERVKDILYDVPEMLIFALFQLYFATRAGPVPSMLFAFIFYGWIGTSSTVRAQFYRFKGQDYVSASRTLGASDARLIFRHILPNAAGFIITASVLSIPGVILSESILTYLGIVNLEGDAMTSVGTMLNAAKASMQTAPHCLFFPAAFISILLVCFNEFGNGLREAFNPSLRGAEEQA